jgi:cytochrome c-type biogenesis protein CcmE
MRRQRQKLILGGIIILSGLGALIVYSFNQSLVYDHSVPEFMGNPGLQRSNCRIYGKVAAASVVREPGGIGVRFTVTDGTHSIPVIYAREVPDTFKEEGDVVVEGMLNAEGVFAAHHLLAKCPSKYEKEAQEAEGSYGSAGAGAI